MKISVGLWLIVAGTVILVAAGTGAWWWWREHAGEIKESAKAAYAEGQRAGATARESD